MGKGGPIWVWRALDKCTGGKTGPPMVPRPAKAKKRPRTAKIQKFVPGGRSTLRRSTLKVGVWTVVYLYEGRVGESPRGVPQNMVGI